MVVRKYNKRGNAYYLNKSTGKRSSKKGWKISLSHRQEKPSYRTRKVDGRSIKVRLGKVRKGISYQKVTSLKKQRSKLYSSRFYWNKKLSELIKAKGSKKSINDAKRKLSSISGKITKLNRKLGVVYEKKAPPKKKREYVGRIRTVTLTHWSGSDELDASLLNNIIKTYEIEGVVYPKIKAADIRMAYNDMVRKGLGISKTPYVQFVYDDEAKTVVITMY